MGSAIEEDEEDPSFKKKQSHFFDDLAYHFINGLEFFGDKSLPKSRTFSQQKYKDMYEIGAGLKQGAQFSLPTRGNSSK